MGRGTVSESLLAACMLDPLAVSPFDLLAVSLFAPLAVSLFAHGESVDGLSFRSTALRNSPYASSDSRRDDARSCNGRMPNSLEMARDSSSSDMTLMRSPSPSLS